MDENTTNGHGNFNFSDGKWESSDGNPSGSGIPTGGASGGAKPSIGTDESNALSSTSLSGSQANTMSSPDLASI